MDQIEQSGVDENEQTGTEQKEQTHNPPPFNESEWIKLIFLLHDTQTWMEEMTEGAIMQVPLKGTKRLLRKSYYLTPSAVAHILEKHYYKIPRHPEAGKFTIPVIEIFSFIRDASTVEAVPIAGSTYLRRVIDTGRKIGQDRDLLPTNKVTIVTDKGGRIITAFPGENFKRL